MKRILLTILLISSSFLLYSQNGTIRGFVFDKSSGEPVIFTNVYLYQTSYGSSTDVNGYFMITKIPAGDYTLLVSYLGYDTLRIPVTIQGNDIITKQLYIQESAIELQTIDISAQYQEARTETNTSVVKITPKDIDQIPSVGGQPDLAQYLQVMPGVVFTGDQGGELYIRGGSPIQNKVLLDGATVYKAFHSIGLFSVFETDIIRNADIYTGGFGAEYGGRISSVMDITTRDGNRQRFSGKVSASTIGANLLLEGPFKRPKEGSMGSAGFILSAKGSYLEQTSKAFTIILILQACLSIFSTFMEKCLSRHPMAVRSIFTGSITGIKWIIIKHFPISTGHSTGVGTNFLVIPGRSSFIMEGHIAYSDYKIALTETTSPERTSAINGFDVGLNFTYFLGKDELKYGIELNGFTTNYEFQNASGLIIEQDENTTEIGAICKIQDGLPGNSSSSLVSGCNGMHPCRLFPRNRGWL